MLFHVVILELQIFFSCFPIAGEMCSLSASKEYWTGALKAPNLQLKGACMVHSAGRAYSGII